MAKITSLCMILSLLFLTSSSHVLARPQPAFRGVTAPMETHGRDNEAEKAVGVDNDDDDGQCDGVGEDRCMMRRTLEAHLDYIYTQNQKQP